jgi:flavin-dependent dehydrogenase
MPGSSNSEPYDVIIAGASFAGLAAARRLRGRILLVDREPIGEGLTSACAAPVSIVEMMDAAAAIRQVHQALVIHTPGRSVAWPLPEPFCTFDYRRFCRAAAAGAGVRSPGRRHEDGAPRGAKFRLASVLGRDGRRVLTSEGSFEGRFFLDATGARAALAGQGRPRYVAFGLESEIALAVEPGLHFYFVPEVRDGHAWAFPCGGGTRFGVLSYRGRTQLLPALERFMARFGTRPGEMHGGYLVTGWTAGVVGEVFVAGDAAGQCMPLTGEGIRTAVLAGDRCGALIQRVLDGTSTIAGAQAAYRAYIAADRHRYRGLLSGNLLAMALPQWWVGASASLLARPEVLRWFFDHYFAILQAGADLTG